MMGFMKLQDPAEYSRFSSIDVERIVLSIILKSNEWMDDYPALAGEFGHQIFYSDRHRQIIDSIQRIYDDGQRANVVTVTAALYARGYEEAPAREYLVNLMEAFPSDPAKVKDFPLFMQTLHELASQRALLSVIHKARTRALADGKFDEKLEEAEALLEEARARATSQRKSTLITMREACKALAQKITELVESEDGMIGLRTGFDELDQFTQGLCPENLIIVAARPGMGKTAFALNIADYVANTGGVPVYIVSAEMSATSLAARSVASASGLALKKVISGKLHTEEDWERLTAGLGRVSNDQIVIDEKPGITIREIAANVRKLRKERGIGLVVVDYLQIVGAQGRTELERLTEISGGLKQIARENLIPVVALSQLSRAIDKREDKRPVLSDLRGSGTIEQDADVVWMLFRPGYYKDDKRSPEEEELIKDLCEVIVAKNRQGEPGVVDLNFYGETTTFKNRYGDRQNG